MNMPRSKLRGIQAIKECLRLWGGFESDHARGEENTAAFNQVRLHETVRAKQNLHRIGRRSRYVAHDDHILTSSQKA
jgi:hypothetical protein